MRLLVEVVARNKKTAWLRINRRPDQPDNPDFRILTMPDKVLPRGTKEARWVEAECDLGSFRHAGYGYTMKLAVIGKVDDR